MMWLGPILALIVVWAVLRGNGPLRIERHIRRLNRRMEDAAVRAYLRRHRRNRP